MVLNAGSGPTAIAAGRDIHRGTVTQSRDHTVTWDANNTRREASTVEVGSRIDASGDMQLIAARDLALRAAGMTSTGALTAQAGRDLSVTAGQARVAVDESHRHTSSDLLRRTTTTTRDRLEQTTVLGGALSGASVTLAAGTDASLTQTEARTRGLGREGSTTRGGSLTIEGSSVQAEGAATLTARGDVRITAAQQSITSAHDAHTSSVATGLARRVGTAMNMGLSTSNAGSPNVIGASLLGSTLGTQANTRTATDSVGSTISAGTLNIAAGRDALVHGSTLVADGDVQVRAARNLDVVSAQNAESDTGSASSTRRGFVGQDGNIAIGVVRSGHNGERQSTTQVSSEIASLGGNVSLAAGERYTQTASSVLAPQGSIDISAQRVDITAGLDTASSDQTQSTSRSTRGGTVSVPIVEAARAARNNRETANTSGDSRLQQLAALNSAIQLSNAAANVVANGVTSGARVGVALGQRQSEQQMVQTGTSSVGSTLMAGQDVTIRAAGAGTASSINVAGSDVTAGRDATLHADGAINLLAATSTAEQHSRNSASGASVGVSFGFGAQNGFAIELAANQARGNADGKDLANVNTHVAAGRTLSLSSGGDTTLRGAVASGSRVETNIGGDLTVESLQDTSVFDARQSSSGFNMSLCIPPICYGAVVSGSVSMARAGVDGDFASVAEHSAIRAGDGGFGVNVRGNTSLVGGAITSTQAAVDADRNSLSTATLTARDIVNRDAHESDGFALSGAYSSGQPSANAGTPSRGGGANISGVGLYTSEGQQSSVTRSGVSGATVTITNDANAAQTVAALNRDVITGTDTSGAITQAWDGHQLIGRATTGASLTQQFGANASRAVADYAERQRQHINDAREADALRTQPDRSDAEQRRLDQLEGRGYTSEGSRMTLADPALQAQYERWAEGGEARVAAHAIVGALGGGASGLGAVQGAAGAGISAAAAPRLDQLQQDAYVQLREAGLGETAARTLSSSIGTAAATSLGAATGGAGGAMTALNQDVNNRQLHPQERSLIERLAEERARRDCRGDTSCEASARIAWIDAMERVARGSVDDRAAGENRSYMQTLVSASADPNSEGARGGLQNYVDRLDEAREMLRPYAGQVITVNGRTAMAVGSAQTYFTATDAQRTDPFVNRVGATTGGASAQRDAQRIDRFAAQNGSAQPVYPVEEVVLGGTVGARVTRALGPVGEAATGGRAAAPEIAQIVYDGTTGPGPLGPIVASTFRSGRYVETISSETTTLYRVWGGNAGEMGAYWTRTPPAGPVQSIIDSALHPTWGNTAVNVTRIEVPAGVRMYEGTAASQGGLVGGGSQVFVPHVDPSWIVK